jgi:hypothetical protein
MRGMRRMRCSRRVMRGRSCSRRVMRGRRRIKMRGAHQDEEAHEAEEEDGELRGGDEGPD